MLFYNSVFYIHIRSSNCVNNGPNPLDPWVFLTSTATLKKKILKNGSCKNINITTFFTTLAGDTFHNFHINDTC